MLCEVKEQAGERRAKPPQHRTPSKVLPFAKFFQLAKLGRVGRNGSPSKNKAPKVKGPPAPSLTFRVKFYVITLELQLKTKNHPLGDILSRNFRGTLVSVGMLFVSCMGQVQVARRGSGVLLGLQSNKMSC